MVPQSWEETNVILDLLPLGNNNELQHLGNYGAAWINCTLGTEWQCFDEGKAVQVWNWDDLQPNDKGDSCSILHKGLGKTWVDGKWHDIPCRFDYAAICKKSVTPSLHV